jgi:quinohemoprotein ethanol dehydrogenase
VLATAGNLVFQGTGDGRLVAYRATDGAKLWESKVGIGIIAAPVTFELDGRQYVSVLAGWGGAPAMAGVNLTGNYGTKGRLLTFVLDGKAPMPPVRTREYAAVTSIATNATPESIERGSNLYALNCRRCHGVGAASGGPVSDLRKSHPTVFAHYPAILLRGSLRSSGMPDYSKVFTEQDVEDVLAYVISRRNALVK